MKNKYNKDEGFYIKAGWYAEDSVVLSREEYDKCQNLKRDVEHSFEYNQGYTDGQIKGSKETAEKIYSELQGHGTTYVKKWIKEQFGVEIKG